MKAIFYVTAFNGAFIATIGRWSAESTGSRKTAIFFRIIGISFLIIGVIGMIFD